MPKKSFSRFKHSKKRKKRPKKINPTHSRLGSLTRSDLEKADQADLRALMEKLNEPRPKETYWFSSSPAWASLMERLNEPGPKESDLDSQVSWAREQLALMGRMLEEDSYSPRASAQGTYEADDYTLMVDTQLPQQEIDLVLLHEHIHADLGQNHYGEMIRRLESFGRIVTIPLNYFRQIIITKIYLEEQDRSKEAEPNEEGVQVQDFLRRGILDKPFRRRIRDKLASNQVFMRGLRFLVDVDKRREMLLPHWKKAQEGGAYWLGLHAYEKQAIECDDTYKYETQFSGTLFLPKLKQAIECNEAYKRQAAELVEDVKSVLLHSEDEDGEAFRMIQSIAQEWGVQWVYPVLSVCVSPDITQISILRAPLSDIERELLTTRFSPDRRLEAIYQMATSHSFVPNIGFPEELAEQLAERFTDELLDPDSPLQYVKRFGINAILNRHDEFHLYELLDPDNPTPFLSVDRFNEFWNSLDADREFVTLMNDLFQTISRELGIPDRELKFKPIQQSKGGAMEDSSEIKDLLTIMDHKSEILSEPHFTDLFSEEEKHRYRSFRQLSVDKDQLLKTMRAEGLI